MAGTYEPLGGMKTVEPKKLPTPKRGTKPARPAPKPRRNTDEVYHIPGQKPKLLQKKSTAARGGKISKKR